jgi:mRNA-degrading endonuclease RelE of RelBE toxin-antitoxin system
MPYETLVHEDAKQELKDLRPYDQRIIIDAIKEQLTHLPTAVTRHRKPLEGVDPPFEHDPPVWELRVGEFRVFYDVHELKQEVHIRAVRRKLPHQTTEEIL